MTTIAGARDVPGTPDEVAAFVTDLQRWPEWFALHKGWVGEVPGDAAVGATFKHDVRILGVPAEITWKVVTLDPPERIVLSGKGSKRTNAAVDFRIEPRAGGSRVTLDADVGGLVLRPVQGLLKGWLDVRVERTLDSLERLLAEP